MRSALSWSLFILGFAFAGFLTSFVLWHWDYYALAPDARLLHASHQSLRSSGGVGLVCGIAGAVLMLLNLLYLVRKRLPFLAFFGTLRTWMGFHVLTGLTSAALIVIHSAFLPRSAIAIFAFVSLGVVVVTGLIGRYIYARVPRSVEGRELELDEIRRRLEQHREELKELGVDTLVFESRAASAVARASRVGVFSTLLVLLFGDREARRQFSTLRSSVMSSESSRSLAPRILRLLDQFLRERDGIARYHELRALMRSWRFLHRWLAILMLLLAVFHIAIAVRYGNLWIFRGGP